MRETTPRLASMGGGSVCCRRRICLRQQTTATRWRRPLPAGLLWPANARCNGAPLSKTKMKADLASRFSVRSARNFIPEHSESYTVSPSATHSAGRFKQGSIVGVGSSIALWVITLRRIRQQM